MFIPTYDVGGTECMVVTREDAQCWVLYCHGNSVSLPELHDSGIPQRMVDSCRCNFVAPEYPVQSSTGSRHDDAVVKSARNAYDCLVRVSSSPVYVVGRSIGVGVALQACAQHRPAGLVLISGFASIKAMAPWGLQWALPDRFDNLLAIRTLHGVPKLILHGMQDDVVPPENATSLANAGDCSTIRMIEGMTHIPMAVHIGTMCSHIATLVDKTHRPHMPAHHFLLWKT